MRLLVTGASGFIGAALVREAVLLGHEVHALSRGGHAIAGAAGARWQLGERLPAVPTAFDAAFHLAHDFGGEEGAARTLAGTRLLIDELAARTRRQFLFSSYSAAPHAVSLYGRTKFAMEKDVSGRSDVVIVRPGLVIGEGGIYSRIAGVARVFPVVPLPDGGRGLVPVIRLRPLVEELLGLASPAVALPAEANLFEPRLWSLRQLVLEAASAAGKRPRILFIPSGLFMALLTVADLFPIRLPVNVDNLKGFLANQASTHQSTLHTSR
jgi:NADH dehydrogenase